MGKKPDLDWRRMSAFHAKYNRVGDCWEWQAGLHTNGYGIFACRDFTGKFRPFYAHRISWAIFNGEYPRKDVLHTCDNPRCVNPDHLYLGTQQDNMRDMDDRGRRRPGGLLTDQQVIEARRMRRDGASIRDLAERYGVTGQTISAALIGRTYRNIPGALPRWAVRAANVR